MDRQLPLTPIAHDNPDSFNNFLKIISRLGLCFFILTSLFFAWEAKEGLTLLEYGDESEKFVGAQLLNKGLRIYRDWYANHGPFLFMLAQLYTKLISLTDFSYIRLYLVAFAALSTLSIMTSPIFSILACRIWAGALFLALISWGWFYHSLHLLLYDPIAGFLFSILLSQIALPALLQVPIHRAWAFISGIVSSVLYFTAYPFALPLSILLIYSATTLYLYKMISATIIQAFLIGAICAALGFILWINIWGDWSGYLIYHIYLNQKFYTQFVKIESWYVFKNFTLSLAPDFIIHTTTIILFFVSIILIFLLNHLRQQALLKRLTFLILVSITLLNFRGTSFHRDSGFMIAVFTLFSLIATFYLQNYIQNKKKFFIKAVISFFILLMPILWFIGQYAVYSPYKLQRKDFLRSHAELKPSQQAMFNFIRTITLPHEKILALVFRPQIYIWANRLPASGHTFYLPIEATYNKAPIANHKIDLCRDIEIQKPKVIWFDNWKAWDKWEIKDYEPCVTELIAKHYAPTSQWPVLFIRSDLTGLPQT